MFYCLLNVIHPAQVHGQVAQIRLGWLNLGTMAHFHGDGSVNFITAQIQTDGPFSLGLIKYNFQHCI